MPRSAILPIVAAGVVTTALLLGTALLPRTARADDEKGATKAEPTGPTYQNKGLGLRTSGPAGWTMVADKQGAVSSWKRLATWNDKGTDAQVVLYTRPRSASSLDALMGSVRQEWTKSAGRLRLDAMRKVDQSAMNPVAKVIVDGSFTRKSTPKKTKDGLPPPPAASTPMRVQATYYLGKGHEYLLYATTRASHWTRLRKGLRRMRDELALEKSAAQGPTGEGSYRNEQLGFSCRFPKAHTVVNPQRTHHVVKFAGLAATDPVLSVYAFPYEEDANADARRLVAYYTEDKAGEATSRGGEVSGTEGAEVTARAMIDGTDQAIFIAVVKRGGMCYRLRCVVPVEEEGKGQAAFRAFVGSFRFGS